MKRFSIVLAIVLALGIGSTALARGNDRHDRGGRGDHHSYKKHHGQHGHHGKYDHHGKHGKHSKYSKHGHGPVIRIYSPARVYYPSAPYYQPPVRVYYPPVRPYYYGYRSAEAELAIGIGRIVGAAIEMGR